MFSVKVNEDLVISDFISPDRGALNEKKGLFVPD